MIRLATECVTRTNNRWADAAVSANVREFALLLAEQPAL
jgi:hypothetical protein